MESTDFAEFYAAHYSRVAAQLHAYLGDRAEAQDVTQEAFVRALDRWARVSRYENALAWVTRVAWNLATSHLRHLQVAARHLARQRVEHIEGPGPDRVALTRALAALPPNHRLAVVLHHLGQLSTSEIAEQRGVAEGTVRSWLSRGRTQLAEQLIEWEPAIPPPPGGVEAARDRVKRRRTVRRATLAAALVLAVLIPLMALNFRGGEPPIIGPTDPPTSPSPTSSPTPAPVQTRRISLPGVTFDQFPLVWFVDARNGWLWSDTCAEGRACARHLAVTGDGGQTWRPVTVPDLPSTTLAMPLVLDSRTMALVVTPERSDKPSHYLLTKDGGGHFSSYPVDRPPVEVLLAAGPRYRMLCPGAIGLEDGAWGIECERLDLVKIGSGKLPNQPPWRRTASVDVGADGRLWLRDYGNDRNRLAVSADESKTWRELPWPEGGQQLVLSPDGREVWVTGPEGYWRLDGELFVKRMPMGSGGSQPVLLGDGLWLVHGGYLEDGVFTPIDGIGWESGRVAADGTVVLHTPGEVILGVGTGRDRQWIRVKP